MTGFESKRQAAQNKMNDDADTLSIVYQRGFADGKRAAQPEQEPVAWMVKLGDVTCFQHHADSKHASVPLYTTPPAAQPEQEPCIGKDPRCPCQDGDACHYKDCVDTKAWLVQQAEPVAYDKTDLNRFVQDLYDEKMQNGKHGHYETLFHVVQQAIKKVAPQRPWLSLTGAEIDANEILRYHFSLNNGPVTRAGMAVVDTVTALLKAKNHG
jgi:hypothetical protein